MLKQNSIGDKIIQAVQKEAAMQRPLPLQASAQNGAVVAHVTLTDHDRLGHLVETVKVGVSNPHSSTRNAESNAQNTKTKAEQFAGRTTYLTEALGLVETDAGGAAILRSTPETMRGAGSEYYEARVQESEISLKRWKPRAQKGGRDSVPFHLTDDTLARLTDDAAQALTSRPK